MTPLRIVGVAPGHRTLNLKRALSDERINLLEVFEPTTKNLERLVSLPMDAVVMFPSQLDNEAIEFLDNIYMTRGRIGIFLLNEGVNTPVLARAMACGVTDVIDAFGSSDRICDQICAGVARLRTRRASVHITERDTRVISLYGTKGGCGKTSLAVNLAVALQSTGKRCALIDLDLQFGDVADLLNIQRYESIADLSHEPVLNAENIRPYLYRMPDGLEVLCAPQSPEMADLVTESVIERLVITLRCDFDFIIFDLAPALDDCSIVAMELSDSIYFVVNPEIPAIRNARTCLNIMSTLGIREKVKIVLNKAGQSVVTSRDVEEALKQKLEAQVTCDAKSSTLAINRGVPVVTCVPRSKMSKDIRALAKKVAGK